MTTDATDRPDAAGDADPRRRRIEAVVAAIEDGAGATGDREVEEAIRKLEAQGGLTAEQRAAVRDLGDAIVGDLVSVPADGLRAAADAGEWAVVDAAVGLFDPEVGEVAGDE